MSANDMELKITADTSSISTLTENDFERFIRDMEKYKRRSNTATYQWVTATTAPHYVELEPEPLYNKHWA